MENARNFAEAIMKQTPKQMERTEEMNGLIATLLKDTQVKNFDEYTDMLDLLDSMKNVEHEHQGTVRLIAGLAELTYQSYESHRERMVREHMQMAEELSRSSEYQIVYDDYKSPIDYHEDEIPF